LLYLALSASAAVDRDLQRWLKVKGPRPDAQHDRNANNSHRKALTRP
jgi:hypothetical protein